MYINGNKYTFKNVCKFTSNEYAFFSVTIFINGDTLCKGTCTVYNDLTLDSTFTIRKTLPITELNHEQLKEICISALIMCRQSAKPSFYKKSSKFNLKNVMSTFYNTY